MTKIERRTAALHAHRPGSKRIKHKAKVVPAEKPECFTDLVERHNWPPDFVSRAWGGHSATTTKPKRGSENGFDRVMLGLKGSVVHTDRWKNREQA